MMKIQKKEDETFSIQRADPIIPEYSGYFRVFPFFR